MPLFLSLLTIDSDNFFSLIDVLAKIRYHFDWVLTNTCTRVRSVLMVLGEGFCGLGEGFWSTIEMPLGFYCYLARLYRVVARFDNFMCRRVFLGLVSCELIKSPRSERIFPPVQGLCSVLCGRLSWNCTYSHSRRPCVQFAVFWSLSYVVVLDEWQRSSAMQCLERIYVLWWIQPICFMIRWYFPLPFFAVHSNNIIILFGRYWNITLAVLFDYSWYLISGFLTQMIFRGNLL
jgi:hypothetical protein